MEEVDRLATTLAILRVNHEREASYLRSYLPFLYHCLRLLPGDDNPIGARPIQSLMESEFGIRLPLGVIRSLLREAVEAGKVREESKLFFAMEAQLDDCDLSPERMEFERRFSHLAAALSQHALEAHKLRWSVTRAKQQLLAYVDRFSSDVLASAIEGTPLPTRPPHDVSADLYVVHEFVSETSAQEPAEFDFLTGLVKARMLSDSLHLEVEQGQETSLSGVVVYLDGPILLYALGYAGDEIQAPYTELITMLRDQGASLCCFHHSVVEAQSILDAAAARKSSGQGERFHGDVVGFLVRSSDSRTEIELYAEHLEQNLAELGIEAVDIPNRIPELQPDEAELTELIRTYIPMIRQTALIRDVDSLVGIHVLRRGRTPRTIASSKAVLVTHNYALFQASARFFQQRRDGRSVPHCIYDASFTTLVWLHAPKQFPELPRERILADAAAAMQPTDALWRRYNDAAQKLFAHGKIVEDDVRFLRYSDDAKALLMDLTRGDSAAFTDATLPELLKLYHEHSVEEVETEAETREAALRDELSTVEEARVAAQHETERERTKAIETRLRVTALSQRAARYVADATFISLLMLIILGLVLSPIGPVDIGAPVLLVLVCAALAVGFSIWGIATSGSLRDVHERIQAFAADRIEAAILRLLQLSP
jgi:hypothetical protein